MEKWYFFNMVLEYKIIQVIAQIKLIKELSESSLEGLEGFNYIWLIGCRKYCEQNVEEIKLENENSKNITPILILWKLIKIKGKLYFQKL